MNTLYCNVSVAIVVVVSIAASECRSQLSDKPADRALISQITGDVEPFFAVWDEDNVYGVLDVAMDGTVLMINL